MAPRPIRPSVRPSSWVRSPRGHWPARRSRSMAGMRRVTASMRAMVCSASACALTPGVLVYESDATFVESLYANAQVTRTLLRIQGPISIEEAREFCQASSAAGGDHRFGAALQTGGPLIALGSVRGHTE